MSKQIELNSRQYLFLLKVAACFLGLLLGSFVLAPEASMQDEEISTNNMNVAVVVNGN